MTRTIDRANFFGLSFSTFRAAVQVHHSWLLNLDPEELGFSSEFAGSPTSLLPKTIPGVDFSLVYCPFPSAIQFLGCQDRIREGGREVVLGTAFNRSPQSDIFLHCWLRPAHWIRDGLVMVSERRSIGEDPARRPPISQHGLGLEQIEVLFTDKSCVPDGMKCIHVFPWRAGAIHDS